MSATQLERIESLKIGVISGTATSVSFSLIALTHSLIVSSSPSLLDWASWPIVVSGAIAFISGFLFGVTYRYVVQAAPNPHLKSGAVMAFGLVRGLAQLDVGLQLQGNPVLMAVQVGESVVMFAIAALILDQVIDKQ
ncbi:MAG TPA: hypothetical protein V6C78_28915 [Crinalium sp.]|jgi:hypothetical protein